MHSTKIDHAVMRTEWAQRGFTCELWIDPPDQIWHDAQHEVDHLTLLLDGICQIEMDGRTVRLLAGDELLIPAGTRHTVRNCSERPARWLRGFRSQAAVA